MPPVAAVYQPLKVYPALVGVGALELVILLLALTFSVVGAGAPVKLWLNVTVLTAVAVTTNVKGMVRAVIPAALTVTVAVYVPAASELFGRTVKVVLPPAATLGRVVLESVKLLAFVPVSANVNSPVGTVPVLLTVMVCAVNCA